MVLVAPFEDRSFSFLGTIISIEHMFLFVNIVFRTNVRYFIPIVGIKCYE